MENNLSFKERNEHTLTEWRNKEMQALDLLQKAGELRFDRSVELVLFRKDIYDTRPSELLNLHQNAANYGETEVTIEDTVAITNELVAMEDLRQARLDIGSLALEWKNNKEKYSSLGEFIGARLKTAQGAQSENIMPRDVILYGFGRIGRLVARRLVSQTGRGEQLRLKAIVIRPQMKDRKQDAEKRAALLRTDSVHGEFAGSVRVSDDGSELIINGNRVLLIYASYPSEIDYSALGINNALVIDNTGVFRTKEDLEQHLRPGVDHVILTAPGKKIPNIVYGVNHESIDFNNDKVLCGASCTTNAIVPPIKVLDDAFGIEKGHVETIHSYTSDQNLLDNFHKKPRRGRAAAINMVITSTGAAEAITAVLPYLDGKITGNAVRVPTPNVSLAIINVSFGRPTTVDEVNNLLKQASLSGPLAEQIGFSNDPEYVSTNGVGMTTACVIDGPSTIVSNDGKTVTVYAWYDNEFGYTCQVVRVAKHVGQVRRKTYY
ncbi:MAG TPA: glyceraldehyde-3-phosphate dehydrogenase [Saprospiraceae bacterium]|nr:MAG: glyceraldehyde-3-phosphate dehydrogenase [Candidatus Parvibacillus calidus]MBX2935685.1 glyceraldehyde-3-phosphate dehydrogenase [Saprospiraceae bacterium]MBK7740361.1 glyceraldehyde-3-phosphate dehydrogenase [Candidatus Parvibacillus calidus]MBX7179800.1 glyceraldehyde-3-phosphate dehydrogenase [Saprospiraceae bacterium]MCB0590388.1 glyceraldehyde-3-phosphate dehydrogenase [Saprospiraceae bacterium]